MRTLFAVVFLFGIWLVFFEKPTTKPPKEKPPYRWAEDVGGCGVVQWEGGILTPNNEYLRVKNPEHYKPGEEVCFPAK